MSLRTENLPAYNAFKTAKQRCCNPNNKDYKHYGGRGIEFRFESFDQLIEAIGPRPDGMTLDRIDTDGHYEPSNVKWSTMDEQRANLRKTKKLTLNGETKTLKQWSAELGISYWTLRDRYDKGWSAEEITSFYEKTFP